MTINFGTLIPILVSILSGCLGCAFLVLAWQRKRKEDITKTWLPAPGIILTSELKEHNSVDPALRNNTVFTPMVRYQYSCAGKTFTGYRISFNSMEYSHKNAQQIVTRFTEGSSVTVFFDPHHPEEAILERNARGFNLMFSTGLILLAVGLGSCCISLLVFWIGKAAG
jgi:hypothetical protein